MSMLDLKALCIALLLVTGSGAYGEAYNGSLIIREAQMRSYNVEMLVDLLNKLPGVKASDGFVSLQGSTTNEVLVLLDGRPLTNTLTGTTNLGGILTSQLASIEIIKGSGSAMYGDNTSGGVIVIKTKKTDKSYINKIEAAAGTYNTQNLNLNVGHSDNGTGIAFTGSYERSDGHRENGDSDVRTAKIDLNHLIAETVESAFSVNYTLDEGGSSGKVTYPTPNARKKKELLGSSAQLAYDGWKGRAYFTTNDQYNVDPDHAVDTYLRTDTSGGEVRYKHTFEVTGELMAGTSVEHRDAEATGIDLHRETLYGLYGIKPFTLGALHVKAGFRVNDHTVFGTSYNPELTLAYRSGIFKSDFKASRSAKTPTIKQRYYESTTVQGNPDLQMESATNYQFGIEAAPAETFTCRVNLFYSTIDDGITGYYNDDDIYTYENVASSTRKGAESSFDWKIAPWLAWNASYLYLIFKNDTTGLYMPSRPKHKVRTDIYVQKGRFKGNVGGYYVSDSYNNTANTQTLKAHAVADAKLAYRFSDLSAYVEVDNLFDREYEVHVGYPAAGRSFLFGITYLF
jgi:vitamin B12 transporter